MKIKEAKTGVKKTVEITKIREADLKRLTKSRYYFDWSGTSKEAEVYTLSILDDEDILGAIAILKFPSEFRYEIKLLASSKENVGEGKIYEGIAGCLIAFTCRACLNEYGELSCVSLVPKTKLKPHYIRKYGMQDAGWQIFLEALSLLNIINRYYNENEEEK